jgi:hypothetical protein
MGNTARLAACGHETCLARSLCCPLFRSRGLTGGGDYVAARREAQRSDPVEVAHLLGTQRRASDLAPLPASAGVQGHGFWTENRRMIPAFWLGRQVALDPARRVTRGAARASTTPLRNQRLQGQKKSSGFLEAQLMVKTRGHTQFNQRPKARGRACFRNLGVRGICLGKGDCTDIRRRADPPEVVTCQLF